MEPPSASTIMIPASSSRPLWRPEAVMAISPPPRRAEKLPLVAGAQPRAWKAAPTWIRSRRALSKVAKSMPGRRLKVAAPATIVFRDGARQARRASTRGEAAVDHDGVAGVEAGGVRGEIDGDALELVDPAPAV